MKQLFFRLGVEDFSGIWKFVLQFIKFGLVGIINTLLFFCVYYSLSYFGVHYILANLAGFILGTLNAYYWNIKYVFKAKGYSIRSLFKVYVSYGFTLTLQTGLLYILVDLIVISHLIAPIITLLITIPTNFLLNKFWSFKE